MKKLLSIQGGKATQFIFKDKPSMYIPFKGDFPLAQNYQTELIYQRIHEHKHLDEIPEEWIRDLIVKGEKMYDIEEGFVNYLEDIGKKDSFKNLKNAEKADLLMKFLDDNCISIESLNI